jgi:hypothetical protein
MSEFSTRGLLGSRGEERRINRGVDDRLHEANDSAHAWVARRPVNLLLKKRAAVSQAMSVVLSKKGFVTEAGETTIPAVLLIAACINIVSNRLSPVR